ncbi:MAG: DNA polymerase/3'-5' exonuclease PolX [Candidatus Aureabacteria bacterium]|nr:DNA polymerase/3'-5' exonuclease PolX [Candidatus Auribacterota bacterium]
MSKLDKSKLLEVLENIGALMELKKENPFKIRAYLNAVRSLEQFQGSLDDAVKNKELLSIKDIGKGIAEKIEEFFSSGHIKYYDELKDSIPPGVFEMLAIEGLGPKKIHVLYEKLRIKTLGDLEHACRENRLVSIEGFGEKTQENILKGIKYHMSYSDRFHVSTALEEAEKLMAELKKKAGKKINRMEIAGSLRRRKEIIGDIDFVAGSSQSEPVMDAFSSLSQVDEVIAKGPTKTSVKLKSGINADIRIVPDKKYPYALHHFTGSKEHNTAMRALSKSKGLKMNEYGLFNGDKNISCKDEKEIFSKLGLSFIPPELREDRGEIELAAAGKIPALIEEKDIKGVIHVHTIASDGKASLDDMAAFAKRKGYSYLGIGDHSKSAHYAGGLEEKRVKEQWEQIDALNKKLTGFVVFKGIESDILPDGSLDYDENILRDFDFIVAAIHSKFKMSKGEMTKRIIKAVKNPYTTMIGHLTGRLLLSRTGYEVDVEKILKALAGENKAIELNANPHRLDLDWRYCKMAKELGVPVSINPDAHDMEGVKDIKYGVGIARKGWLEKKDILNVKSAGEIKKFFDNIKRQ